MKYRHEVAFFVITIVFVLSRIIIFNGFNGSDDLHYAMLAVRLLNGTYNPFEPNDIFSGRILLVALQSVIYKVVGISPFTTAAGTIIAVILSCQLTIFRLLPDRNILSVLMAASLFYFNPALTQATVGVLPDAYIMLAGTIILVLLKKDLAEPGDANKRTSVNAFLIGLIIAVSLFIKETALVFLPTAIVLPFVLKRRRPMVFVSTILLTCIISAFLFVVGYYIFAGDPFIKLVQIRNSSYPNPCNFAMLPARDLLIRLSYGVWQNFIVNGFYPVVLALGLVLTVVLPGALNKNKGGDPADYAENEASYNSRLINFESTSFIVILLISLFFPFSLNGYEPLCADPRHFLFLIPFAVLTVVNNINKLNTKRNYAYMTIFALVLFSTCIMSTQNKWQWMIYLMFFVSFLLRVVVWPRFNKLSIAAITLISIVSIFESLFFLRSDWFKDMQALQMRINRRKSFPTSLNRHAYPGNTPADTILKPITYYFIDHDIMMHWKLLNRFNEDEINYFNLHPQVYKVYKLYYQVPDTTSFIPGWLILKKTYAGSPAIPLDQLNSPETLALMPAIIHSGEMDAYLITNPGQLIYVRSLIVKQNDTAKSHLKLAVSLGNLQNRIKL